MQRGEFTVVPAHAPLDELWARYRGPGRFDAELVWAQVAEDMARHVLEAAIHRSSTPDCSSLHRT
jgi:hypothetical protein